MSEAEIGAAIRDFLINTGLVDTHEVEMERKPSESSAGRVDLRTRDLIIEFKVRIGNQITPDSDHVRQLDDYLKEAVAGGEPQRFGILTDGKYWILRWPGMGPVSTQSPNAFTLTTPDHGLQLFEWLRDQSQALEPRGISPTEDEVRKRLGAGPRFEQHLDGLRRLYEARQHDPTVQVKRELWRRLLGGRFFQESTGLRRPLKHSSYPRSAAGISLRPAPASTLLTRLRQHIGLAKWIEIPALRAGMTGWWIMQAVGRVLRTRLARPSDVDASRPRRAGMRRETTPSCGIGVILTTKLGSLQQWNNVMSFGMRVPDSCRAGNSVGTA